MGCGASKSGTGSPVAVASTALIDGHDSAGPVVTASRQPSRAVGLKSKAQTTSEFAFEPKAAAFEEEIMPVGLIAAVAPGTAAMLLRRPSSSALSSTAKLVGVPTFCPSPYKTYGPKDQSVLLPTQALDELRLKSVTRANKDARRLAQPSADAAVNSAQAAKALDEAEAALRTSMTDLAWTHGPNHVETAKVIEALADVLTKKGQCEEAAELQASVVAAREAAAVDALDSMRKLVALYASLGHVDALAAVAERIRTVSASA